MTGYNFFAATQGIQNAGTFEMGGDDLPPIPDNTQVLAVCEEAKWDEYQGVETINLKWRIAQPQDYNNRVVFHKLKAKDADMAKAQKAMQMLAAIDFNAGGKMVAAMQARSETMPSGESLQGITNVPMMLKLGVWELEDKSKAGNWVRSVAPYARAAAAVAPAPVAPVAQPAPVAPPIATGGFEIPF